MSQADIPDPTPEDDVIPHQERIEFVIDQRIAAARKVPASVYLHWTGTAAQLADTIDVPFTPETIQPMADYTGSDLIPDLPVVFAGSRVKVAENHVYAVSWFVSIGLGTSSHDGKFFGGGVSAKGLGQETAGKRYPIVGGGVNMSGDFTEYIPVWGAGGYGISLFEIQNAAGATTPIPGAATINAFLMITQLS